MLSRTGFGKTIPHYAAYALEPDGTVQGVDLGPVAPIDASVRTLRGALTDRREVTPLAKDLRMRLFGKLPTVLGGSRMVVAPDGLLGHVPFEVVLADGGNDRVPRVTYLTSGRELPHLDAWDAETTEPVLFFDVDYGGGRPWAPLPGTAVEGERIVEHFGEVRALRGSDASEASLNALHRPTFLHVASHGFFESQADPRRFETLSKTRRGLLVLEQLDVVVPELAATVETDHPALRSGVVFAGANRGVGIVTAAEWSNLDLRGTRFVVLSACETALGEIRNGQGIYGLRRALVLAGVQAQVLSLWDVDDDATAELMSLVYEELAGGATLGDSLHAAKQRLAAANPTRHPYFWAAFTVSGRESVLARE